MRRNSRDDAASAMVIVGAIMAMVLAAWAALKLVAWGWKKHKARPLNAGQTVALLDNDERGAEVVGALGGARAPRGERQSSVARAVADSTERQDGIESAALLEAKEASRAESRVHHFVDRDGALSVDWRRQFEEISLAWHKGDYGFARDWLQKLAYRLKSEKAPEVVHAKFKELMAEFTRDDPVYAEVMREALPMIAARPGIVQSQLSKQLPQFNAEHFRYALYYAEVIGDVIRQKKGRSYALTLPPVTLQALKDSTKQMGTVAIKARRLDYAIKRRDQMLPLTHLRPFWQLVGPCASADAARKTLLAGDPFWTGPNVPWNCEMDDCECRVHSLSRLEMERYVNAGCSPGDEAAADQLRMWEQGDMK